MIALAEERDGGIDLDGVDMGRAHAQRSRDVVAAAGADDRDALRRLLEVERKLVIGANVLVCFGLVAAIALGEVEDLLVVGAARQDVHQAVGRGHPLQQLIGRIDALRLGLHRPGQDGEQEAEARDAERQAIVARQHEHQQHAADHSEPDHRRQPDRLITNSTMTPRMLPIRLRL